MADVFMPYENTHKKTAWAFPPSSPDTERCVRDIAHLDLELGELEKKEG